MREKKEIINRYICTYFTAKSEKEINNSTKQVKVISACSGFEVEHLLYADNKATYIKYIRDLNEFNYKYFLYNNIVFKLEQKNNTNLYYAKC